MKMQYYLQHHFQQSMCLLAQEDLGDEVDQLITSIPTEDSVLPRISDSTQRTIAVSTDNAANISKAICETSMHHIRCLAHCINLSAQKFNNAVSDVLARVRIVVRYFHNSPKADNLLKVSNTISNKNLWFKKIVHY